MRWIVIAIVVAVALPACTRVNTEDSAGLSVARAKALVAQSEDKLILNDLKTLSVGAAGGAREASRHADPQRPDDALSGIR